MCTAAVPASIGEALGMLRSGLAMQRSAAGFLAAADAAGLPAEVLAEGLRELECADATGAAVRGRFLEAFDAADGHVADGQRTARVWLVHCTRVTKGQAAEHLAVERLSRDHPVLHAALAEGWVISKSVALQLAKWTRAIPGECRAPRLRQAGWPVILLASHSWRNVKATSTSPPRQEAASTSTWISTRGLNASRWASV
jgi:hypothetical protein